MTMACGGHGIRLLRFASDADLARAAAAAWLNDIAARPASPRPHCVALSGGRITLKFFAALLEATGGSGTALASVEFFWADERCVPPSDRESSFGAADKFFFQPLAIAPARIHRIRGEEMPEFAARQAEAEICRIAPLNPDAQPMLDLILLGMGEDGHVASLFPGEPASESQNRTAYRVVRDAPKPPPVRITLGYAAIQAAEQVWVLASGPGKEAALAESLRPRGKTPLARVLEAHPRTSVFTDIRLL